MTYIIHPGIGFNLLIIDKIYIVLTFSFLSDITIAKGELKQRYENDRVRISLFL